MFPDGAFAPRYFAPRYFPRNRRDEGEGGAAGRIPAAEVFVPGAQAVSARPDRMVASVFTPGAVEVQTP